MSSFMPGSLAYLRSKNRNSPYWAARAITKHENTGPVVIIKSLGKDPNNHECFEVLVNDQVLMAWDDELEKRD
jgi:hypothetical protein